ncbi:tripartite tricarboxylate transporter TctB family protein [Salinicola peritrichatus]|uniref:tripartite tricarboxylate transporter TctB family protein n=1 Tax=Salinicola peritrichatus TaxID=1267424 RepID=UPI000DA1B57D|nr:tripartite tricarboxylate transporter TctB family protein [Salinicola peritrichatus]
MSDQSEAASHSGREVSSERGRALANVMFNAALAVFFVTLFIQAGELPSSMWEPLGAGSFPRLVLGALVVFNLAIMAQSTAAFRRADRTASVGVGRWFLQRRLAFATLAAFALYALLMPWIGFALASLVFLLAVQVILGARRGRRLLVAVIVAVVCSLGLYALFSHVFLISLPPGRLW